MTKISIFGIGHVGSTIAYSILQKELADEVVLINRRKVIAQGEAADLNHAAAFSSRNTVFIAGELEACFGSNVVVFCMAASIDKSQTSRNQGAVQTKEIVAQWLPKIAKMCPDAVFIIVSNPVDAMSYFAWQYSGLPAHQVIGTGTLLDSARYRSNLSHHLQIHPEDIRAYVLGEHGDSQFPAMSVAATGGERLDSGLGDSPLFQQTVSSAKEIFQIKGYTNFAIASSATVIIESIVYDGKHTLPVSTLIDGYCGISDVYLSIPCVIGKSGVIKQLQPHLTDEEIGKFRYCAQTVRSVIDSCN